MCELIQGWTGRRQWRKMHIGIDAETFDIRAIEGTSNAVGDGQTLPDLLAQIPENETIVTVDGHGAYDTRGCHAAGVEVKHDRQIDKAFQSGDIR